RYDVASADKNMGLAEMETLPGIGWRQLYGADHDEQRIGVTLDLRALMRLTGVLDRKIVQVEFALDVAEHLFGGLVQTDPDEAIRVPQGAPNVFERDVRDAPAAVVFGTRDDPVNARYSRHYHAWILARPAQRGARTIDRPSSSVSTAR